MGECAANGLTAWMRALRRGAYAGARWGNMNRYEDRDNLWGIDSNDRRWFQALTLAGGVIASIMMAFLEIEHRADDATPNTVARNILLSIGASFVAAGFVSWAILQAKELTMAIADWIREATEKRRRRIRREAYMMGYEDATKGKPMQPPTNGTNRNGSGSNSDNGELK